MTWTRLDDLWTDLPELADLAYDVRWHYLAMIQFCSRTQRYDGLLKKSDARRCSDVDDPAGAIQILTTKGLVIPVSEGQVKITRIDEHIPPPSVRAETERSKIRKRRSRLHKEGDHSTCLPENCDQAIPDPAVDMVTGEVTKPVTRDTRTGQDRTGQDLVDTPADVFDLEEQMQESLPDPQPAALPELTPGPVSEPAPAPVFNFRERLREAS